jgi:hypothetical protein
MNIGRYYWFTGSFGTLGIVTGEDKITGVKKAYIGQVSGTDEDMDAKHVTEHGTPLHPSILKSVLQDLGEPDSIQLSNQLALVQAEAEGYGTLLLDVQMDCINAKRLLLKILTALHKSFPTLPEFIEMLTIPIVWDAEREEYVFKDERKCRVCGCTDLNPCVTNGVPCHWVEEDLCSACVGKEPTG